MKSKFVPMPWHIEASLARLMGFFDYAESEELPLGESLFRDAREVKRWLESVADIALTEIEDPVDGGEHE